jgi:glycine oxidase
MTSGGPDVVIIGGGICGIATAYYLARSGVRSTVIERDGLASHASGFAYGGLSGGIPNGPHGNYPVIAEGMRLHRELAVALKDETDIDTQFQDRPALKLALSEADAADVTKHLEWQQAQPGYTVTWLGAEEARKLEPRIAPETVGALHIDGGADVEPYRLTLALAQASERRGVTIRSGNVTDILQENGQVTGVLVDGEKLSAGWVVLAMGPWAAEASAWVGLDIPIRPLKGQIIRLRASGEPYNYSIGHLKNYAMTKPSDGLVWCGTTEEEAGFDESKTTESRDKIIESTLRMLPGLADAEVVLQTACLRPVAPDDHLVLGSVQGVQGLYMNTGAGRQGIMMGPAMGKIIADLIVRGECDVLIGPYSPGRFPT